MGDWNSKFSFHGASQSILDKFRSTVKQLAKIFVSETIFKDLNIVTAFRHSHSQDPFSAIE